MNGTSSDPASFFSAVQRGVRKQAGKALAPELRRWRHTLSSDNHVLELAPHASRFLIRYGVLDAGTSEKRRKRAYVEFVHGLARRTGDAPGMVEAWLNAFAGGVNGARAEGLCGEKPKCVNCPRG